MCSFITQHNATDVASFEGACNCHTDCRNVHQSCYPWVSENLAVHPSGQLLQQSVCITKEFLHKLSETVPGKLICMIVVLIGVSTRLHFIIVTDLSGQILTFDGVWYFGEVFSSRMNPVFYCTEQRVDSVYGVVWVSGLLMSMLWIEWPMVAVGLWYGQAYVMNSGAFY